jgi:hypothetical protein
VLGYDSGRQLNSMLCSTKVLTGADACQISPATESFGAKGSVQRGDNVGSGRRLDYTYVQ